MTMAEFAKYVGMDEDALFALSFEEFRQLLLQEGCYINGEGIHAAVDEDGVPCEVDFT